MRTPHALDEERIALARAKNTARAEARRRHRQARTLVTAGTDPANDSAIQEAAEPAPRRRLFALPDVRGDLRALPRMLLTRKRLWIPFALVIAAFLIGMAGNRNILPDALAEPAAVFVQLVLPTQSLIAFFLAGFLAPRASYLVGLVLGLMTGPLFAIYAWEAAASQAPAELAARGLTFEQFLVQATISGALFGTIGAGFAAWYRGFLRSSQERGRQNRIAREQQALQRRKEAEREARRSGASRRTTTP
ncbi:MAG: hypothetical protein M3472_03525 [Chloroflexota bacterium]|nr:hypothetical protein [Chloroflexota bacterium]